MSSVIGSSFVHLEAIISLVLACGKEGGRRGEIDHTHIFHVVITTVYMKHVINFWMGQLVSYAPILETPP